MLEIPVDDRVQRFLQVPKAEQAELIPVVAVAETGKPAGIVILV